MGGLTTTLLAALLGLAAAATAAAVAATARAPDLGGRLRVGVTWVHDLDDHTSDPRGAGDGPGLCVAGTFERTGMFETSALVGFSSLEYRDPGGAVDGRGTRVDVRLEGRIASTGARVRTWVGYGVGVAWVRVPPFLYRTYAGDQRTGAESGWTLGADLGLGIDLGPPAGRGGFIETRLMPDVFGPHRSVMKPLTVRAGVRLP